jgi:hypothetical protein
MARLSVPGRPVTAGTVFAFGAKNVAAPPRSERFLAPSMESDPPWRGQVCDRQRAMEPAGSDDDGSQDRPRSFLAGRLHPPRNVDLGSERSRYLVAAMDSGETDRNGKFGGGRAVSMGGFGSHAVPRCRPGSREIEWARLERRKWRPPISPDNRVGRVGPGAGAGGWYWVETTRSPCLAPRRP